jgi:hypothetical protein
MSARDPGHPHERISALLDGELDPAHRAEVEAHLGECPACRAFLEGLRAVSRAAAEEDTPPVPAGLEDRIGWRLRSGRMETAVRRARPWWRSPVPLTAAATIATFGILFGVWRLERGEPGVPELPVRAQRGVSREKDEASASRAVPPPVGAPAPTPSVPASPPPPRPERAKKEKAPPPGAPREAPKKRDESRFAPAPPSRAEESEPRVIGGVVGGVVGGVMGGYMGEAASDEATRTAEAPAAPTEARQAAPAAAKLRNVAQEGQAGCANPWMASPPPGWSLRSADPAAAGAGLVRLAARLGGRGDIDGSQAGTWHLEVPRERWPEFAAALRDVGVAEADPLLAVPTTAVCAEVRVTIVP